MTISALVHLYGFFGMKRPDEMEKIAREAVVRYPAEPRAHIELIDALLRREAEPEAEKAVAAARAALPKTAAARLDVAHMLAFRAQGLDASYKLPHSIKARMAMGRVALGFIDEVLALNPGHEGATHEKAEFLITLESLPNERPLSLRNMPADQVGVQGFLRLLQTGQIVYSSSCGAGFYAPTFAAPARPKRGEKLGLLRPDEVPPGSAKVLEKYRYAIEMTAPPSPDSPASCNGVPAGQSARTYFATARPLPNYSGASYRIDAEGTLTRIK